MNVTHGLSNTREYVVWNSMMYRCYNPTYSGSKNYAGRGITVCDRWHDVANFITDIGPKPGPEYTIERVDNDKGYSPDNCRWATGTEQQRNKRTNKLTIAEAREIRMLRQRGYLLRELAEEFGISMRMVSLIANNQKWKEEHE